MVKQSSPRTASWIAALVLVAAAAIGVHALALATARAENPALLGPGSRVLLAVLFGFLLLLACRHLAMLALATSEQWANARGADELAPAPLVSIIVPAFNEGAMIRAVLESLFAIDYSNYEVLVIDDGSSDETFLRALPFQRRRPEIECRVLAKPNGGKFDALNHRIAQAPRGQLGGDLRRRHGGPPATPHVRPGAGVSGGLRVSNAARQSEIDDDRDP